MKEYINKIVEPLQRLKEKDIVLITSAIYFVIIILYELLYCNYEFIFNVIDHYNFSVYRIIVYISVYILFCVFKDKFIKKAIDGFKSKLKCFITYIAFYTLIFVGGIVIYTVELIYISIFQLLIFALLIFLLSIYISNDMVHNAIIISLLIGIIFSITITFNNQLDEKRHFLAAYSFSVGNFNLRNPSIDKKVADMPRMMNTQEFIQYFNKYPENEITKDISGRKVEDTPCDYYAITYFISAIGIFIAKILGGSIADIYITGRIFNLLGYVCSIALVLKVLPYKKNTMYLIFFMPMLLALSAVYSPDGISTAICALCIAYCFRLQAKEEINIKDILKLILLFILVATIKNTGYIGLALVALILPIRKIIKQNKKYIKYIVFTFLIMLLLVTFTYKKVMNQEPDARANQPNASEQLQYIMQSPMKYGKVLLNHARNNFASITQLRFLNAPMFFRSTYKVVFDVLLVYILFISITDGTKQLSLRTRLVFLLTFMTIFSMTSTAMYLAYTKVGNNYISGFQARYMFPILFLLLSSISIKKLELKQSFKYENAILSYISLMPIIVSAIDVIF